MKIRDFLEALETASGWGPVYMKGEKEPWHDWVLIRLDEDGYWRAGRLDPGEHPFYALFWGGGGPCPWHVWVGEGVPEGELTPLLARVLGELAERALGRLHRSLGPCDMGSADLYAQTPALEIRVVVHGDTDWSEDIWRRIEIGLADDLNVEHPYPLLGEVLGQYGISLFCGCGREVPFEDFGLAMSSDPDFLVCPDCQKEWAELLAQ